MCMFPALNGPSHRFSVITKSSLYFFGPLSRSVARLLRLDWLGIYIIIFWTNFFLIDLAKWRSFGGVLRHKYIMLLS